MGNLIETIESQANNQVWNQINDLVWDQLHYSRRSLQWVIWIRIRDQIQWKIWGSPKGVQIGQRERRI